MHIAILGYGREGKSVLRFLQNRGLSRISTLINADEDIWILDQNPKTKVPREVGSQLGKNWLKNLSRFDLVFRSPGVPYNLPELRKARRVGIKFSSATKLFFEQLRGSPRTIRGLTQKGIGTTIIGITGTKGKGTTATLLYKILKAARKKVFLAGNIGTSALDILPRLSVSSPRESAFVILELSSFQLQDLEMSPHIAVVLDIFPDHQDAHLNLREYYEAKTNIARHQKAADKIFFFSAKGGSLPAGRRGASGGKNGSRSSWAASKSPLSARLAKGGRGKKIAVDAASFKLFKPVDLRIPGIHNFKNAVMAATVAQSLGVSAETIARTVKNFRGLEHRLEFVRRIKIYCGSQHSHKISHHSHCVNFYNDSASTNPHTTAAAVRAFPNEAKILIAGGFDKGLDYKPLADALKNSSTKLIILFGENKHKIHRTIKNSGVKIKFARDLGAAVKTAYKFALKLPTTYYLLPTVILFSPGAASFDMFKNYADRGDKFKKIVHRLTI